MHGPSTDIEEATFMYQQKGSMGARIGALFLDGIFLWIILFLIIVYLDF